VNDDYSSSIFYSFIYENLFYLQKDGKISSNIFQYYSYDQRNRKLELRLKKFLSFSNGKSITTDSIIFSINEFLKLGIDDSKKLSQVLKGIKKEGHRMTLSLNYDYAGIISLLTSPQLVLKSRKSDVFSGVFFPEKWIKGEYILLKSNPYYPGGRSYLDSVRIVFSVKGKYPDIFLSNKKNLVKGFDQVVCGIYENTYLIFSKQNTQESFKRSLYTLFKDFGVKTGLKSLEVLTSNEESPVFLNIKKVPLRNVLKTFKYSKFNLFFYPSLKWIKDKFNKYLSDRKIGIKPFFLDSKVSSNYSNDDNLKYIVLEKSFQRAQPLKGKIKKIMSELLFSRYNENFLRKAKELDELSLLKKDDLMMDKIAEIISEIVKEGIIYPLFQKDYFLYVNRKLEGFKLDYYGRPVFDRLRYKNKK
jgi:MarR-like DNA-binding transcriptional regulator SgrR of sgrS sRNA